MGKLAKSEPSNVYNLVYRQFSRQRYAKYKHQFPKLRESEIVSKIIKEWDSLDKTDKERLLQSYESDKFISKKEVSEPDSPRGSVEKVKIEKSNLDKTAERSVRVKTEYKQELSNVNDSEKQGLSEHDSSKKSEQCRSNPSALQTRKIVRGHSQYLSFYKFYYDKYHKEHKDWNSSQLTKIISMLWQRRKLQHKQLINSNKGRIHHTPGSKQNGKKLFMKKNQLTAKEAKIKWAQLPKDSKIFWKNPTLHEESLSAKFSRMKFRCQEDEEVTLPDVPFAAGKLSFLNNYIG